MVLPSQHGCQVALRAHSGVPQATSRLPKAAGGLPAAAHKLGSLAGCSPAQHQQAGMGRHSGRGVWEAWAKNSNIGAQAWAPKVLPLGTRYGCQVTEPMVGQLGGYGGTRCQGGAATCSKVKKKNNIQKKIHNNSGPSQMVLKLLYLYSANSQLSDESSLGPIRDHLVLAMV